MKVKGNHFHDQRFSLPVGADEKGCKYCGSAAVESGLGMEEKLMHLAGWNFTVNEGGREKGIMKVIDVQDSDFFRARETALRQFKPGSIIEDCRPLSEEEMKDWVGNARKWIPLNRP